VLLVSAWLMQGAWAQFNVSGPGFLPDENGTNLDDPQANKGTSKVAAGAVIKDCAECPEMVLIPAGSFVMGSDTNAAEMPLHPVTIRSFLMGRTEVTQRQWRDIMGNHPSYRIGCGDDCPVDTVSYNDVQEFITKLNQKLGEKYRVPSEAEWEYAARAGTTTKWSFGDEVSKLGDYAWYYINSGGKTQAVGQKLPNAFGLFDMYGNVYEWTQDCWHKDYVGAPTDGSAWTTDCAGPQRQGVVRGGSLRTNLASLRSAHRSWYVSAATSILMNGFRLARDL